jgi:hypothetical protein
MIFVFFTIYYLKEWANKLYGETYYTWVSMAAEWDFPHVCPYQSSH